MFESFFIFDGKFCEHCDGVEVDFPWGPTLANVFIYHFENICRRFVDDTFLLFRTKDDVEKFKNYLSKQNKNKIYVGNWEKWFTVISGYNNHPWKQ